MRKFEKISYNQFKKDVCENKNVYDDYKLPSRKTINSAGYDFCLINDIELEPNQILRVPTGIKAQMNSDEMLMLFVRSSVGFKYNVRLTNQVGIIDSDYYNNSENEGHIWISVQNQSIDKLIFKKGQSICQGIFVKFFTTDDEVSSGKLRKGGLGSTGK